jgi:hypothetical protein
MRSIYQYQGCREEGWYWNDVLHGDVWGDPSGMLEISNRHYVAFFKWKETDEGLKAINSMLDTYVL